MCSGEQLRLGEGAGCNFPATGAPRNDISSQSTFLGGVWPGRARGFGKVRTLSCIFHLTASRTYDSLLRWSVRGHIVVGEHRDGRMGKEERNDPGTLEREWLQENKK